MGEGKKEGSGRGAKRNRIQDVINPRLLPTSHPESGGSSGDFLRRDVCGQRWIGDGVRGMVAASEIEGIPRGILQSLIHGRGRTVELNLEGVTSLVPRLG